MLFINAKNRTEILNKHFSCSSAAIAMAVVVSGANASLIAWSPNIEIPNTNGGMYFNVETKTTGNNSSLVYGWDLNPYGTSTTELKWYAPSQGGSVVGLGSNGVNFGVANLPNFTSIGPTSFFGISASSVQSGGWELNAANIFGFKFKNNAYETNYGYGIILIGANMGVRRMVSLVYESDGSTIQIPPGIPTPSVMPLLALWGFVKRRRRS